MTATELQTDWLDYNEEESAQISKEIEAEGPPPTQYIDADANQMERWYDAGLCRWCGSQSKGDDCVCRRCPSCSRTWLANTIEDTWEGLPPIVDCDECVGAEMEQDEQARIDDFNAGLSERERLTEAGYLHEWD